MNDVVVLLIDDVHLEHRNSDMQNDFATTLKNKIANIKNDGFIPILVCAGDINERTQGIEWLQQFDCEIVYVCGNHEFWGGDYNTVIKDIKLINTQPGYSHIHFLYNETVILHNTRFIGGPLWTNFLNDLPWVASNKVIESFHSMADFKKITAFDFYDNPDNITQLSTFMKTHGASSSKVKEMVDKKMFNPLMQLWEFEKTRSFIEQELKTVFSGKTVVVTHHLPVLDIWSSNLNMKEDLASGKSINNPISVKNSEESDKKESFSKKLLMTGFYANNLKDMFFEKTTSPDLWVHGHYHKEVHGYIGMTQISSSPIGHFKNGDNKEFKIKEIFMTSKGSSSLVKKYLTKSFNKISVEKSIVPSVEKLEHIIQSSYIMYHAGLATPEDFDSLISGLHQDIVKKIQELSRNIALVLSSYIEHTGIVQKKNYQEDYYLTARTSGLHQWIIDNKRQDLPALEKFIVNANSFSDGKQFDNHYTDWLSSLYVLKKQLIDYQNTLNDFGNSLDLDISLTP